MKAREAHKEGETAYMWIVCQCGHEGTFTSFTTRPISGDLPPAHYQCPRCSFAWQTIFEGTAHVTKGGFVIPPPLVIKATEARL